MICSQDERKRQRQDERRRNLLSETGRAHSTERRRFRSGGSWRNWRIAPSGGTGSLGTGGRARRVHNPSKMMHVPSASASILIFDTGADERNMMELAACFRSFSAGNWRGASGSLVPHHF